jgi:protein-S-isoprenylcysteine O-methyltransferase Ste14
MNLKMRLGIRMAIVWPLYAALLFLPAGSLRYWQGWVCLVLFVVFSIVFAVYFYRRDPKLLERRMRSKEPRREQKLFQILWTPLSLGTLVLGGLDYRFGWSTSFLNGMPLWLMLFSQALLCYSWCLILQVFRVNTFAATVVQVEAGQKVISTGPYGIVRHPMYSAILVMVIATPFALGSYVALAPSVVLIPVLVFRLLDEERVLRQELTGYPEYCLRTRFRLIPNVW